MSQTLLALYGSSGEEIATCVRLHMNLSRQEYLCAYPRGLSALLTTQSLNKSQLKPSPTLLNPDEK